MLPYPYCGPRIQPGESGGHSSCPAECQYQLWGKAMHLGTHNREGTGTYTYMHKPKLSVADSDQLRDPLFSSVFSHCINFV